MDEFRVITNEIGSLIESVVQYAREHNPVSERYKRVCNDFLRSVYYPSPQVSMLADRKQSALCQTCKPKWSRCF